MTKYKNQQAIDEFRQRFVKNVTKQVDTSNSIVLPMWKDNHSHLSSDVEQFLDEQLTKKEEEVIERVDKFVQKALYDHDGTDERYNYLIHMWDELKTQPKK